MTGQAPICMFAPLDVKCNEANLSANIVRDEGRACDAGWLPSRRIAAMVAPTTKLLYWCRV